jgi:DNA mismatch repair protein MutL
LQAALNQAYRGFLEKDQYAEAFLFLSCPYGDVDVNVHPAKAEIRFMDSRPLFQLILHSVEKAMLKEQGIKEVYPVQEGERSRLRIKEGKRERFFPSAERKQMEWKGLFPPPEREEGIYPRVLGQHRDTYIIASSEEGIFIVRMREFFLKNIRISTEKRNGLKNSLSFQYFLNFRLLKS